MGNYTSNSFMIQIAHLLPLPKVKGRERMMVIVCEERKTIKKFKKK